MKNQDNDSNNIRNKKYHLMVFFRSVTNRGQYTRFGALHTLYLREILKNGYLK
jgi:hypothetical protein